MRTWLGLASFGAALAIAAMAGVWQQLRFEIILALMGLVIVLVGGGIAGSFLLVRNESDRPRWW